MVPTSSPDWLKSFASINSYPSLFRGLHCPADHHQPILGARHRASHQQQVPIGQHFHNLQILHSHTAIAHAASHASTFPDMAWVGTSADRAWGTPAVALAMCLRA